MIVGFVDFVDCSFNQLDRNFFFAYGGSSKPQELIILEKS